VGQAKTEKGKYRVAPAGRPQKGQPQGVCPYGPLKRNRIAIVRTISFLNGLRIFSGERPMGRFTGFHRSLGVEIES
jgi:hypothetical protein